MLQRHRNDREEIAWAAGFFDGEGCFSYIQKARYVCLRIGQSELEPLERFREAVGLGKIYGPYSHTHKDRWSRRVCSGTPARAEGQPGAGHEREAARAVVKFRPSL